MSDAAGTAEPVTMQGAGRRAAGRGALIGSAAALALGCSPGGDASPPTGRACTAIGCQDGLLIRVLPAEAWPHGQYRFDIEQDGGRVVCTGTLPLPPCGVQAMVCDAPGPMIVESGCALPPAVFRTTPAAVAIVVTHDGQPVGAGRWRPVYQTIQPNGPGCEPICKNAAVELVLAFEDLGAAVGVAHATPESVRPESFEWFSPPGNPGLEAAWVVGAEREPGLYAQRVRLAAGARIAPHTHPDTRYSTVPSGTLYVGFGSTVDDAAMVAVPAGAVYVAPANQPHYLWARDGEVVYQESGMGPTGTVAVVAP